MLSTHTSKSNSMKGTFRDTCPLPLKIALYIQTFKHRPVKFVTLRGSPRCFRWECFAWQRRSWNGPRWGQTSGRRWSSSRCTRCGKASKRSTRRWQTFGKSRKIQRYLRAVPSRMFENLEKFREISWIYFGPDEQFRFLGFWNERLTYY